MTDQPVDPETQGPPDGRPEGPTEPAPADLASGEVPLEAQLAERTADLQRLQAEYVNYKKRVDRDRDLVRKQGESAVLRSLLTVLDDLGRAEQHGELTGGFKAVADQLQAAVKAHGLEPFGQRGEPFDPGLHEAVLHSGESDEVDVTTLETIMRIGYRVGDRVLRPATVAVVDPAPRPNQGVPAEAEPAEVSGASDDADEASES